MAVIRGEQWTVTWAPQYRDNGVGLTDVEYDDCVVDETWLTNIFGVFAGANLPDPNIDFDKHWAYGDLSNRNYYVAYKGKAAFAGGIGDILLLNGASMRLPFGPCATTMPPDVTTGTTLNAAAVQGTVAIGLTAAVFAQYDVVCVGGAIPSSGIPPSAACEYAVMLTAATIYPHIEFTNPVGVLAAGAVILGATATLTVQMATGREAHGAIGGTGSFIVGETVSAGAWSATCTRPNTGFRFSHMIGTQVIKVTDGAEDGLLLAGKTSVLVSNAAAWTNGDYMCIGYGTPYAEVRTITKSTITMSFTKPLSYDHGHSGGLMKCSAAGIAAGIYTHTLCETRELPAIQIAADYTDVDGAASLMRRYCGVKCNTGSYKASEGSVLRMSIDGLIGRTLRYRDLDASAVSPWYSANIVKVAHDFPTTEPYYFSQGRLTFGGSVVARARDFSLDVNNGIEPKYYMNDQGAGGLPITQPQFVPWELREGKREYRCAITVDVDPNERNLFADLCRMGTYTTVYKGFQLSFVFTRGTNDTITFTMPPLRNEGVTVPAAGGDSQGCLMGKAPHNIVEQPLVSVPLDIDVRSVGIVIKDTVQYYP